MKRYGTLIAAFNIFVSLLFLVILSDARADSQEGSKEDIVVSALHLENNGLAVSDNSSGEVRDRQSDPLSLPLKEGLSTFVDFVPPPYTIIMPKDSRKDYRAVLGFRFCF
jgi:hypothetical protein